MNKKNNYKKQKIKNKNQYNIKMVLGFILYEAFDVVYHLGSLLFGGGKFFYRWYYGIDAALERGDVKEIEMLLKRIEILEKNLLLTDRTNNSHKQTKTRE